jgi:hypothetical protein
MYIYIYIRPGTQAGLTGRHERVHALTARSGMAVASLHTVA